MKSSIVTIDGPAGSGKSTVSKHLAKRLSFLYLDTGAMYRAVALKAAREGVGMEDQVGLGRLCEGLDLHFVPFGDESRIYIGDEDISQAIRTPEMDMLSSGISAIKEVRRAMTALQRKIGEKGDLVAEGRDMGTIVFPTAEHKFFVTASPETRAERRFKERQNRGESVSKEEVLREILKRDDQDSNRSIAPLRPAEDAKTIDTTALLPIQVVEMMIMEISKESG